MKAHVLTFFFCLFHRVSEFEHPRDDPWQCLVENYVIISQINQPVYKIYPLRKHVPMVKTRQFTIYYKTITMINNQLQSITRQLQWYNQLQLIMEQFTTIYNQSQLIMKQFTTNHN
jgi:hypothetical protein